MTEQPLGAVRAARRILREVGTGSLATLDESGHPFASFVGAATDSAGSPVLLLSDLAVHTQNLKRDARASLLLVAQKPMRDPMAASRLTLVGNAVRVENDGAGARFLARHPEAAGYASFKDFAFYRMAVAAGHLVAGFGRIVEIAASDLILDLAGAEKLVSAEAGAVAHMNEDYADAVRLYATKLLGREDGDWRLTGLDPQGCDLALGAQGARLEFETRVDDPGALRAALVALAAKARAA